MKTLKNSVHVSIGMFLLLSIGSIIFSGTILVYPVFGAWFMFSVSLMGIFDFIQGNTMHLGSSYLENLSKNKMWRVIFFLFFLGFAIYGMYLGINYLVDFDVP